jgi:hypothetical protein
MADYNSTNTGAEVDDAVGVAKGAGTGLIAKTGTGAGVKRAITGTIDQITVADGDGVAGNPTLSLPVAVTTSLGLADTAVQPADIGTAAAEDIGFFATAAQGALADTAVQPADIGTAAAEDIGFFATAAQGSTADSALQSGDNVSDLTNDAAYVTSDPTGVTGADAITNMMSLTQAEYDAIVTPNASTFYVITG